MSPNSDLCLLNVAKSVILFSFYTEVVKLPPGRMLGTCSVPLVYFPFHMDPLCSVAQCEKKCFIIIIFFYKFLFVYLGMVNFIAVKTS